MNSPTSKEELDQMGPGIDNPPAEIEEPIWTPHENPSYIVTGGDEE